jgi:hypothetical protein
MGVKDQSDGVAVGVSCRMSAGRREYERARRASEPFMIKSDYEVGGCAQNAD